MENNEMLEDNGFENFEDQEKYKSVALEKERRANVFGKMALIISILCIFLGIIVASITEQTLAIFINDIVLADRVLTILLCIPIGLEIIAIFICVWGLMIKRTVLLKRILLGHILYWLSRILGLLFLYGLIEFIFGWFK